MSSERSGFIDRALNTRISRRKAIMLGVGAAIAAVSAPIIENEVEKHKRGVETDDGIFKPLYEIHNIGIEGSDIPKPTNIFYREGPDVSWDPASLLAARHQFGRAFKEDVLAELISQQSEIMYGDVNPPNGQLELSLIPLEGFMGASVLFSSLKMDVSKGRMTRRKFIKRAGIIVGAWGLSPIATSVLGDITRLQHNQAIQRISNRLDAISLNAHPEIPIVFFRSLIMANNMLEAAREYKDRTGQKPVVAFNVGAGHAQIEDFLQAGQEFCRALILAYPDIYLKAVSNANEKGIESLYTSVLFTLPKDIDSADSDLEKVKATIISREVVDRVLERKLRKFA